MNKKTHRKTLEVKIQEKQEKPEKPKTPEKEVYNNRQYSILYYFTMD